MEILEIQIIQYDNMVQVLGNYNDLLKFNSKVWWEKVGGKTFLMESYYFSKIFLSHIFCRDSGGLRLVRARRWENLPEFLLLVEYYLMSTSLKLHKDPSFR